jgi:autotransporter passenger strand-loop-strand repeat protein
VTSGGAFVVSSGATASGTTVSSGGLEYVSSGGANVSASVLSGGTTDVLSGGVDSGAIMSSGGYEYVASGGTVSAPTISGGTLELASGSVTGSGPITFGSGGTLLLDSSVTFGGKISSFAKPDYLDLADVAFGSSTTLGFTENANNLSGTLSVSDGTHTANLILIGQYVTAQFTSASDGHGGILIGDPPIGPPGNLALAQNPQHHAA